MFKGLLDLQENQALLENQALQDHLEFQVMLEDLVNLEKRVHLGLLDPRDVLDFLDQVVYQGSLEKEDCLAFQGCLV